jgi:hypothetical protein
MNLHPRVKAGLAAWMLFVAASAALYQGGVWGGHRAAARSQVTAQARIEDQVSWDHGPVYRYSFRFHERALSGESGVSTDQTHRRSELVVVYVDARDPARNSLIPLSEIASRDLPLLAFYLLAVLALAWQCRLAFREAAQHAAPKP